MSRPDWYGDPVLLAADADRRRAVLDELEPEELAALAEVPTAVLDALAAGNEASLIGALARARHGGVQS